MKAMRTIFWVKGERGIRCLTHALEAAFDDVLRGRDPRYAHWRSAVEVEAAVPA